MSSLLSKFNLIIKHGKTDVFHFSRAHGAFNPLLSTYLLLEVLYSFPKISGDI